MAVIRRPADYQSCFLESENVIYLKRVLEKTEHAQLITLVVEIIGGLISAISASAYLESFIVFLLSALGAAFFTVITYFIFKNVILHMKCNISVVYHSEVAVRLQLFDMDESKQVINKPKPIVKTAPITGTSHVEVTEDYWKCCCCGRKNHSRNIYCVDCGTKKP